MTKLELADALDRLDSGNIRALIGFDGFVDEIVHVVDKRLNCDEYIRLDSMAEYGKRITRGAGYSTNIEMVTVKRKLGGNGPILANAMVSAGVNVTYIGALGSPDIHPVFADLAERAKLISLCDPAHTDAIEFFDGKIISSKLESFREVSWSTISRVCGEDRLASLISGADVVGFENWTMLPHMSDIFRHILDLGLEPSSKMLFIDIADPEKRDDADVLELLSLLGRFSSLFRVTLGLNLKEAKEVAAALGRADGSFDAVLESDLEALCRYIYDRLDIQTLVVHPVGEAAVISGGGFERVLGPYCSRPKLTTGAGDNFNSGFILGQTLGLPLKSSLLAGCASSGFYVRNSRSPDKAEIAEFLRRWSAGDLSND